MSITFKEQYERERRWAYKVQIIELFHLAHCNLHNKDWTVTKTAEYFDVSIALISENLKLARAIDKNPSLLKCGSRTEALRKVR